MSKADSVYLKHILDAIARIEEYANGIKYEKLSFLYRTE